MFFLFDFFLLDFLLDFFSGGGSCLPRGSRGLTSTAKLAVGVSGIDSIQSLSYIGIPFFGVLLDSLLLAPV